MAPQLDVSELQSRILTLRKTPGRRYPAEVIEAARQYISRGRDTGESLNSIARQLGVAQSTILRWEGCEMSARSSSHLRRVAVSRSSPDRGAATVVGPCGVRVEGLDITQVAALFRELSGRSNQDSKAHEPAQTTRNCQ